MTHGFDGESFHSGQVAKVICLGTAWGITCSLAGLRSPSIQLKANDSFVFIHFDPITGHVLVPMGRDGKKSTERNSLVISAYTGQVELLLLIGQRSKT